jgi:hypothetical protein
MFMGYDQVTGRLGDRSGSFVLQHVGTYEAGAVNDTVIVVPGSATGCVEIGKRPHAERGTPHGTRLL